jgi:hypothetical protein
MTRTERRCEVAVTSVRFGSGVVQRAALLSSHEVEEVLAAVDSVPADLVHTAWTTPASVMWTIGAPLYRNRDRLEYYVSCARDQNRRLYVHFRQVHERIAQFFEERYGDPVVFAEELAVPGFHVFEYPGSGVFDGGGWHFDQLYGQVPYLAAHAADVSAAVNFTLPVLVPSGGTGMELCDDEPGAVDVGAGAHLSTPYLPGVMVFTEREYWHRIGPSTCREDRDRRVTLQGHGVRFRGRWILFW